MLTIHTVFDENFVNIVYEIHIETSYCICIVWKVVFLHLVIEVSKSIANYFSESLITVGIRFNFYKTLVVMKMYILKTISEYQNKFSINVLMVILGEVQIN